MAYLIVNTKLWLDETMELIIIKVEIKVC